MEDEWGSVFEEVSVSEKGLPKGLRLNWTT